jgi:hypothetical protein
MNEFVAKKLGEVLAFNNVGNDTLARGKSALIEALGEEKYMDMEEKNRIHGEAVIKVATEARVIDTTLAKAEKTEEKLKKMRDLYVGDQWDNATELFEWGGFFEGAAIVHWNVVKGAAQALNLSDLLILCEEGINWHYEVLEISEGELEQRGADKAQQ